MGWQSRLKEDIEGLKKKENLTSFSVDGHLGSLKFFNVTNYIATLGGVSLDLYIFSIVYIPIR